MSLGKVLDPLEHPRLSDLSSRSPDESGLIVLNSRIVINKIGNPLLPYTTLDFFVVKGFHLK